MRVVVTGYNGNVGSRLIKRGYEPLDCNVAQEMDVKKAIKSSQPDLIIHLASKSNVNYCEDIRNMETVMLTNLRGSANVFKWADFYGAKVIFISSDHVFSGNGFGAYSEGAKQSPRNYYGVAKLAVEALAKMYDNVKIIRTSTLFWNELPSIKSIVNDISNGKDVHLPIFMWRSFMHIDHFVDSLMEYSHVIDGMPKILNLSGDKVVSWHTFMKYYARENKLDVSRIHARFMDEENKDGYAPRPHRAGLSTHLSKQIGFAQYNYMDGVADDPL